MISYTQGDTSKLPVCWLVYYHKGEIKVKKGTLGRNFLFFPENENIWHTGVPHRAMQVNSKGKVLCWHEEDVPVARGMICEYYINKVDNVSDRAVTALENIKKMIAKEAIV